MTISWITFFRITCITELSNAGAPIDEIMAVTDHRNKESVKRYLHCACAVHATGCDLQHTIGQKGGLTINSTQDASSHRSSAIRSFLLFVGRLTNTTPFQEDRWTSYSTCIDQLPPPVVSITKNSTYRTHDSEMKPCLCGRLHQQHSGQFCKPIEDRGNCVSQEPKTGPLNRVKVPWRKGLCKWPCNVKLPRTAPQPDCAIDWANPSYKQSMREQLRPIAHTTGQSADDDSTARSHNKPHMCSNFCRKKKQDQ